MATTPIYLTTPQLVAALERLEGRRVPTRTVAYWAHSNLLIPGVDYARKRGAKRLYTLRDLARARLIVRLQERLSTPKVRVAMAALDAHGDMRELFRRGSRAVLMFDKWRAQLFMLQPGQTPRDILTNQLHLPLWLGALAECVDGNEEAAREAKRRVA